MFLDLHVKRAYTEAGPQPIYWRDLAGYAEVRQIKLSPEELYLLNAADSAALEQMVNGR